jgi:hypothetical protein
MQNSNKISFQKGVDELKQMFPNYEEDIIICVLLENDKVFEKAVDALLAMHIEDKKVNKEEPEISIFSKKSSIVDNGSFNRKENIQTHDNKIIQSSKKETVNGKGDDKNKTNTLSVNKYDRKSFDNRDIKMKNSFGQKFKSK